MGAPIEFSSNYSNLSTLYCSECGAKLQPNAKFCADCGNKVA
jgi:hypothetical protein